jgi:hypothetical protein
MLGVSSLAFAINNFTGKKFAGKKKVAGWGNEAGERLGDIFIKATLVFLVSPQEAFNDCCR